MEPRPLWRWLGWRFTLAGVLPLLLVAALLMWVMLPQVMADIEARHQALARAIAGQVEEYLRSAGRELSAVAEYLEQPGDQPASVRLRPILDAHAGVGEVFAAIYVAAADDAVYAVGLPSGMRGQRDDLLEVDLSRWPILRQARERQAPVWSEVFLSAVSARLAVSLAIPVADQVLIGEVAIDGLSGFLGRLPTEAGMLTMVLDRRGQIIAHSQSSLGGQQLSLGHLPIVDEALRGRFARHDLELDGEAFVATLVTVPQPGWTVLVAQPRHDALRPFRSTLWALAVDVLAALLLASGATLILARRFAQRIGRYTEQAHAIAEGDYAQPWPALKIRELDRLADELDRMSQAIRQREGALRASEVRFRDLSALASDWFWEQDEQFRFTYFSFGGAMSALERVGIGHRQLIGRTRWELPVNLSPEAWRAHRTALEAHQPFRDFEYPITTDSGGVRWFSVNGQPLFDDSGRFTGYRGTARDITRRKLADEALRQANLVVENSPAILFRWRAEEGWPTVFVSDNVTQLGYTAGELRDGSIRFASLIHPDDLGRVANEVQRHSEQGSDHFGQEYRIVTRDGSLRWVDDRTAVERNAAGQITHYQGIVIDISERKRAEEALRRVNRQLRMISDCNQALIRADDEIGLLRTVCAIVVESGGYRMARVAYAEHASAQTLQLMAHAGDEPGWLDAWCSNWTDGVSEGDASATVIRTGRPCLVHDMASQPFTADWRRRAVEGGYVAECALPLQIGEQTLGALSILAATKDAFDSDEVVLLSELAGDLAFGITVLRTRKQRDQADAALRESEFLLRRAQQVGDLGSYYFDTRSGNWISSEKLDQILGIDDSYAKTLAAWLELVHPLDRAEMLQHLNDHVLAGGQRFDRQYRIIRRVDGEERWVHGLGELEFDQDGVAIKMIGTIQDITASLRAEQALQESEARYRLLFDSNPHPMWVYDLETLAFLTVNDAAIDSYGYSRAEFLNMTLLDLGIDEGTPLLEEDVIAVEERGDYNGFWRHRRRDGSMLDVEIIAHAVSFEGRPAELVLANDITERRRSEQALLASELKYRELVENANSIILRWNPAGEITFINEFGLRFFGYAEAELLGRQMVGTIVPRAASSTGSDLRPLMERICLHPDEFAHNINENMRRNGERVWVSWTNKAVFDDWGQVVEVFSVGSDVTEQKRAQAAARESEERFAKAFNASPAPLAISVIENGRFLDVNEQMLRMLCYRRAEMIGHSAPELGIWADPGARQRMVARLHAEGSCRELPTRFRTRTGDVREALYSGEIIRLGEEDVLLSLIIDVTERRRAEQELQRHREHLEELVNDRTSELRQAMTQLVQTEKLAALGNLVAGVAHELNTPLGNSRVVASLLGEEMRAFASAARSGSLRRSQLDSFLTRGGEAVELLERNSARAADLIGHFTQVAVDQSSARRRSFDLRQTCEEMLSTLRLSFKHSQHQIELDIPFGLQMDSYPGPLEQVIGNLVSNSVTHGFAGFAPGRILLQAATSGDHRVLLRYSDDGVGMPTAILRRVFEPFFTTRLGQGGSGLGLYLVYNLVSGVLGGSIEVDSAPGEGTRFTLNLPRCAPQRGTAG